MASRPAGVLCGPARNAAGRRVLGQFLLLAARERGWDVHGIDVSPDAVRHASTALDLDARVATLEDAPFPPRSFDAITIL